MVREKGRRGEGVGRRGGVRRGGEGEGCCRCGGGLWIFVALGLVLEMLGVVLGGVYLNVTSLTTSLHHVQILPTYVPVVAVLVTGVLVLILFCKRWSVLVFVTSMLSVAVSLLCATTSVLMGTHILQPMLHFTHCTLSRDRCHCYSPYHRQDLALEYSDDALTSYVYEGVSSCDVIESDLIHALFAMCAVYVMLFVVCALVAVVGLLAFCAMRLAKPVIQSDSYEEIFTVSQSSSSPHASDDSEQPTSLQPLTSPSPSSSSQPPHHPPPSSSSFTANPSQFIYSPSDIPLDYNEACRMRQRSHSFSQPRRQNHSFDSSDSSPAVYTTSTLGRGEGRCRQGEGQGQGQGRLKEHRRRARRAVTLANLDHQQLMLIMSLQLRYLQENNQSDRQFQLNNEKLERQTRRSLTPDPCRQRAAVTASASAVYSDTDQRPVKLVRSHTPVPHPTYLPPPPTPSSFFPLAGDYENAGGVAPLVDYENVDSCVSSCPGSGQSGGRTSRQGSGQDGQREGSKSRQSSLSRGTPAGVVRPSTQSDESAYVVMHGAGASSLEGGRQGEVTSSLLDNSYENVDSLSARDAPRVAHRDPLYENQKESLAARRLKTMKTDSPRQARDADPPHSHPADPKSSAVINTAIPSLPLHPSSPLRPTPSRTPTTPKRSTPIPPTSCHRPGTSLSHVTSDADKPARPKSYISAVEGDQDSRGLASSHEKDDTLSVRSDSRHNRSRHFSSLRGPDFSPLPARTVTPGLGDGGLSESGSHTDIYALPKKKERMSAAGVASEGHPRMDSNHVHHKGASPSLARGPPFPGQDRSTPLPGQERSHRSAFHHVGRHHAAQGAAPCDTDLDDLDPLPPSALPRKRSLQTPPYSSPPSYQSLSSSRHGSQHSLLSQLSQHSLLSSSSHLTADDLDSELYKQIRKNRSAGAINGGLHRYANGDAQPRCTPADLELRHPGTDRQHRHPDPHPYPQNSYHSSILRNPYPRAFRVQGEGQGRGQGEGQGRDQAVPHPPGWNDYYYPSADHAGIHSFPFRKHHPPYSAHNPHPYPLPHPQPTTAALPVPATLAKSYENLDDVFPPLHRPPRAARGGVRVRCVPPGHSPGRRQRPRHCGDRYLTRQSAVFHLATAQDGDSDPDTVETVI
ncbi:hypothetical protein ACOMHN_017555 [Nucella lapillus]